MSDANPPDSAEAEHANPTTPNLAPESWQKRWRIVGAVTIAICAVMAGFGVDMQILRNSQLLFLVYWGVFALLFFVTLYVVALDLRYIRAQHAVAERDLFRETLGEGEFREALREAVKTASDEKSGDGDSQ